MKKGLAHFQLRVQYDFPAHGDNGETRYLPNLSTHGSLQMVHKLTWMCFSVRQSNPNDVGFCKMDIALITWCQSKGEKLWLVGFFFVQLHNHHIQLQEDTKQKFLFQKYVLVIYEAQVQIQTKPLLVSNQYSNPKGQWFAINPHSWKNYFRVA
jgi:hypothetical protein